MTDLSCRPEIQCLHAFGPREFLLCLIGFAGIVLAGYIAAKTWGD